MNVWEKNPLVLSEYEWNVELGMKGGWIWCIEYVNNENEWEWMSIWMSGWLRICYGEWSDYKMKWDMYEMNMIIECRWEWNEYEVEKKKDEWVDRIRWLYWVK